MYPPPDLAYSGRVSLPELETHQRLWTLDTQTTMAKITIICDTDTYRLSLGKDESDEAEYGDPAFLTSGRRTYMALVCEDDHGTRYSLLDGEDWAVELKGAVDVEFEDAAEGDESEIAGEPEAVLEEELEEDNDGDSDTDNDPDVDPDD